MRWLLTGTIGYGRKHSASYSRPVCAEVSELQRSVVSALGVSFSICLFALVQPVSVAAIMLPITMNYQGFTLTITYYSITGPNTVVLVGSIENDGSQTVKLMSLTGSAYIGEVNVGTGSLDQQYLTLIGGMVVPASATVTTPFNIYTAVGTGLIVLGDESTISFYYATTPVTISLTASVCSLQGSLCLPWSYPLTFNATSTLAQL